MAATNDLLKKADELLIKIRRLSEKQEKLQADLKLKDEKIASVQKESSQQSHAIQQLQQQVASLKLGSVVNLSEPDKKEVRQQINEYLKELDKVISKLEGEG